MRKREAQRAKITADVNGIHDTAKKTVEDKLKQLELHGKERFNKKVTEASIAMEANVKRRKEEWKKSEYEKRGVVGDIGLWWTDNMGGGLDTYPEVKKMYEEERNAYLDIIDAEIKAISDEGNKVVEECKTIILEGRKKVFEYLSKLKGDNEDLGRSLAKEISKKFDGLEDFVDKKKEELGQKLCQMRDAAVAKIDALIEKMHEESAGLLVKALNLGIDLLIAPFRFALGLFGYDMTAIDDVIRRVKRTFTFIISYPLEFAKRMIRGIGEGFSQFGKNIKSHLINTLVGWLTGALMDQPVKIPEKWNASGILQFIGSLVGIGSEMVMGLIKNLLPEEVIEQAEKLLPVFMRIPEEGPGALWEYIQSEAQSMKETAIAGVRDAVITQLAIIGLQKLMNVLTLGGSDFADAAKMIYDMILFFKNNWRKIVDLVTKIFNTLSAVAENDTKGVADGIENTMGRSLQVVFGFFMTSLGLGGVVNTVIGVFRRIGDILRKAVQRGVDFVVKLVKDKLGRFFKKKGGENSTSEHADESEQSETPTELTPWLGNEDNFLNEAGESHTIRMFGTWDKPQLKMASNKYIYIDQRIDEALMEPNVSPQQRVKLESAKGRIERLYELIAKERLKARKEGYSQRDAANVDGEIEDILKEIAKDLEDTSIGYEKVPITHVTWGMDDRRAGWVKAEPLSKLSGNTLGGGPAGLEIEGWEYLKQIPDYDSNWVRAHLLNDNLQGPGTRWNLTPATRHVNLDMMEPQVENIGKTEVKAGSVLSYFTNVKYEHAGGPKKPGYEKWRNAFKDFPSTIDMSIERMSLVNRVWQPNGIFLVKKHWTISPPPSLDGYPFNLAEAVGPGQINSYTSLPYSMCELIFDFVHKKGISDSDGLFSALQRHYLSLRESDSQRQSWFGREKKQPDGTMKIVGEPWSSRLYRLFDRKDGLADPFER